MDNEFHVGFTGSRSGINSVQVKEITSLLTGMRDLQLVVHHGDCIGADTDFHNLCLSLSPCVKVVIHPPTINTFRAFNKSHKLLPPKPYLVRNHDIVDAADIVIACPFDKNKEELRSGTWATIRYCKKQGKTIYIF